MSLSGNAFDALNKETNESISLGSTKEFLDVLSSRKNYIDKIKPVCKKIKLLRQELMSYLGMNKYYQYCVNFDIAKEQQKLHTFLGSDIFSQFKQYCETTVGFDLFPSDYPEDENNFAEGIVYIKIYEDINHNPVGIKVGFKGEYNKTSFIINLLDGVSEIARIRDNNLTFLDEMDVFIRDANETQVKLTQAQTYEECIRLVDCFNVKYNPQLRFSYVADETTNRGNYSICDSTGRCYIASTHTLPAKRYSLGNTKVAATNNELNAPPLIHPSTLTFWNKPCAVTTVAMAAVGLATVGIVYSALS